VILVYEEVETTAKGGGPSQHEHIPLLALGLNSNKNDGGSGWEEKNEGSKGKAPFE